MVGSSLVDMLQRFTDDAATKTILLIGGTVEEEATAYIAEQFDRPVAAFIAGQTTPPGKCMG